MVKINAKIDRKPDYFLVTIKNHLFSVKLSDLTPEQRKILEAHYRHDLTVKETIELIKAMTVIMIINAKTPMRAMLLMQISQEVKELEDQHKANRKKISLT